MSAVLKNRKMKIVMAASLMLSFLFIFDFCFAEVRASLNVTGYPIVEGSLIYMSASIDTVEKGEVLMYREVMTDEKTSGGDRVITGYFYVPTASGISWASISNPELLFKVWIDRSGRVDINYVHVSVPRITTYSWDNKNSHGGIDIQGDVTIGYGKRYFRHYYNTDATYGSSYE